MLRLITADQVLPGPAGQHISDGAVLIDGETITAVGQRAEVEARAPADVPRRDYPDHTLLPGLINCHVHLSFDASEQPLEYYQSTDDAGLLLDMAGRAQQAMRAGVTTMRDLGDRDGLVIRLRETIARGELYGPRILAAAAPLTINQGHCHFFGGEVSGEAAIRRQIQHNAALGADVIKVMASGGQITSSSPPMWENQFDADELRLVVEEATAHGLPVAAHAHGTEAIADAVAAGVSTIEHCTWMSSGGTYDQRDDIAKRIVEHGIHACVAWPPAWPDFLNRFGPERAEQILGRLRWMKETGIPILPGTDAGLRGSVFDGFARALGLHEYLGFTPATVIDMATTTSAHALGIGDHTGQIAPGYSADILVVEGDPLSGVAALERPSLVLARGRPAFSDNRAISATR